MSSTAFSHASRPQRRSNLTPALYKASIKTLANAEAAQTTTTVEKETMKRIRKCLQKANYTGTGESEVKAAFNRAAKLMAQYNISQAEVLAHETPDARQKHAGQSVVDIKRADGSGKAVTQQGFIGTLAFAMTTFFDCKSYVTARASSIDHTFYGLSETQLQLRGHSRWRST